MSIKATPNGLNVGSSGEADRAIRYAIGVTTGLFEHEKTVRAGSAQSVVHPMTALFVSKGARAHVLTDSPFGACDRDAKELFALAVRLVAHCTDAWGVAQVGECWIAHQCAACGSTFSPEFPSCRNCGAPLVPPRENPYRREGLFAFLNVRGLDTKYRWMAYLRRADDGTGMGWLDEARGVPCPATPAGRLEQPWALEPWMAPHFVLNCEVIAEHVGAQLTEELIAQARSIELAAPPDYSFLRIDPHRLRTVLRTFDLGEGVHRQD